VHLVGFTIEIYYDARSYKRQLHAQVTLGPEKTASGIIGQ